MNLKTIEYNKYIRDIKYWQEEVKYNDILDKKIEFLFKKDVYKYIINNNLEKEFNKEKDFKDVIISDSNIKKEIKDNYIKKLYREIVKQTHPDKIKDKKELFLKASESYNDDSYLNILLIANDLNIDIEYDKIDYDKLKNEIDKLKKYAEMTQTSLHWKWYHNHKDISFIEKYVDSILFPFI